MRTTIDKAGRVVIPAAAREKAGFGPGTELEVVVDEVSVRLIRTGRPPVLSTRGGGRTVARPQAARGRRPTVDLPSLVEEERNRWPV
jgi:AbrB family looped-hinge helix DNA binding protein